VTFNADGWFDINAAAYVNKGGDTYWKEETVGQVNLYGGRITTGATGSLNINAANTGATIASFSSSQTALIDATGGQVALNGSRTISVENGSQTTDLEIRGAIANSVNGTGSSSVTKTGAGQLSFTGTEANSYTGATTVNGGTLELAKSDNVTSIAGSVITVNSGGTLLLSASEQINNAANLTMNSGTLATSDINGIETLGTLTLTGNSVIDLGNAAYLLKFANSSAMSWSGTLTIYGWMTTPATSGTQNQIYFGNNASGLTNAQLAMVSFNGFGPGAMLLSSGELVPVAVPEAGPFVAAALLVLAVAWRERRRLTNLIRPLAAA
jgi:autotransporter-associated beta strand protein